MNLSNAELAHLKAMPRLCDFNIEWEFFCSAYNASARVTSVFEKISAAKKKWAFLPEYSFSQEEVAELHPGYWFPERASEDVIAEIIVDEIKAAEGRVCIDITGFMRPQILSLVHHLKDRGISGFDAIYTEPKQYRLKERTPFSGDDVEVVRQVVGFEGQHSDEGCTDILIIGMGYDDSLVSRVVTEKDSARVIQLLSLPSLSADMYQESLLRLDRVRMGDGHSNDDDVIFAPANNPFVVACELERKLEEVRARLGGSANVYLSPLATKAQALGFALFCAAQAPGSPISIIFPFSNSYSRETSIGVGRTWLYEIEF